MFNNRIQAFVFPNMIGQPASDFLSGNHQHPTLPHQVHVADIYEAARRRAIEEHELDKLFNPDFYDYQI